MTTADQILSGIEAARAAVSQTTLAWEPANLSRVQASLIALQDSIPRLKASLDEIPSAGPLPVLKLRGAAQSLRDEAAALEFLVDAAAAFIRSSAAAAAANTQTYNLAGEIRLDVPPSAEAYTG